MEHFKHRLKEIRLKNNLTQKEMSSLLGLGSYSAYQNYESGRSEPSITTLKKIANTFKIDLHWLITGSHFIDKEKMNKIEEYSECIDFLEENKEAGKIVMDIIKDLKKVYDKIDSLKKVIDKYK